MKWSILLERIWDVFVYVAVAAALGSLIYYIVLTVAFPINPVVCGIVCGLVCFLMILWEERKLKAIEK